MPSAEMNMSSLMSTYSTRFNTNVNNSILYASQDVTLDHFKILKVVGRGSFGKVYLVQKKDSGEYFAMKRLKKADIIKLRQVDHVISENTILADIDHPFLVGLKGFS